ncbi:hypothetical protein [Ottowia sp. VDI28]|uniref:hypothetical protein n=1 Tax=Ottowia sp. VDI28 TaxID=3133968 RepID=UPI003C2EF532
MNEVPSVMYPVGRSPRLGVILLGLWLAGAVTVLSWWADQASDRSGLAWRLGLLLSVLALTGWALHSFWRTQIKRQLAFDGDRWHLSHPSGAEAFPLLTEQAQVAVLWDAQRCMLLRWPSAGQGARRAAWLWAEASSDPLRWHLLRCALYSPANRPAIGPDPEF